MEEAEGDKRNCKRLKMDISWTYDEISLLKESGNSFPGKRKAYSGWLKSIVTNYTL